ncbi:MAG: sigma-70 family RNA polymerase sigma factor [Chitinispirillaceae bacterium]|nr:sigma-70 family RNA polymerase sigma factor [Chitinispirillaceae bacterium]
MTKQDRTKLAGFFSREYNRMAGFVRSLIEEAADYDSEDIVQDLALNLFSRADITAPIEDAAAYVYQALRNRVVDRFRRRRASVSLDSPVMTEQGAATFKDLFPDHGMTMEQALDDREMKQRLYKEIDALPDEQKAVLVATEFGEKTFAELSAQWQVPIGTLLARKSRALSRLRQKLVQKKEH